MEKFELMTLENEIKQADSKQIKLMAEESARSIAESLEECSYNIQQAKEDADYANNIKTGLFRFGSTRRKANATANAVVSTNKAIAQMNDLIQETIKFTCISLAFAKEMNNAMASIVAKGFEDNNGNMRQLSNKSKESMDIIMKQAEAYIDQQSKIERLENAMKTMKNPKLPYIISAISLIVSIIIIVLFLMK